MATPEVNQRIEEVLNLFNKYDKLYFVDEEILRLLHLPNDKEKDLDNYSLIQRVMRIMLYEGLLQPGSLTERGNAQMDLYVPSLKGYYIKYNGGYLKYLEGLKDEKALKISDQELLRKQIRSVTDNNRVMKKLILFQTVFIFVTTVLSAITLYYTNEELTIHKIEETQMHYKDSLLQARQEVLYLHLNLENALKSDSTANRMRSTKP